MEKLLIVDGNSLANRAFYALPPLSNKNGEFSNAIYGFVNLLIKFINEHSPTKIAVAFDHSRNTFRKEMYTDYKGTRKEMPIELRSQMPVIKDILKSMNIQIFEVDGIEADDIIGTIAKNSNMQNIILSGDRDVLQLIDKNTEVWLTKKGVTNVEKVDNNTMQDIFGYTPKQVIDMKSLMGDASDNIPGVAGIGEKTAKDLITKYQSLNGVYEHLDEIKGKLKEKLQLGKEMAYLSYKLATIKTDCNIDLNVNELNYDFPFGDKVREYFEKYQFNSLLKRLDLFSTNIKENKDIVENKIKINSISQIKEILATEKIDFFAFNFINKIEFCFNETNLYYVENQANLFDLETLNTTDIINELENILLDETIDKITCDLKSHFYISNKFYNMKGNIFDISISMYLIKAGEKIGLNAKTIQFNQLKKSLQKEISDLNLDFVYNNIEMPLTYLLYEMEQNGFCIDGKEVNNISEKYTNELKQLSSDIYNIVGMEFNINSPKQLADILFDVLKLNDKGNKKHSTSIDILNSLEFQHPVIPLIIRYRKIQKLNSTYVEVFKKLIEQKGECIHTIFNQTLTATGRLSSSEPNLQNIPVRDEEGRNLRKLFISRFKDGQIISADYNQIELRLLASFSNDENLIEAYKNGNDIHLTTASQIFEKPMEEVTSNERRMAKAVNFGIVYGISAFGLSNQINTSVKDAKVFMDKYLNKYPKVINYMNDNIKFAKENGYAKTLYGRIRRINELYSANKNLEAFGERVAMNMPLQGSASDIIKLAMIKVARELKKEKLESKLILQIHDELIVDAKKDEIEKVKQILSSCMENVAQLKVPLIVNIESGKTWFDAK